MATLNLVVDKSAERDLAVRANKQERRGHPLQLRPVERAIQFLRGVHSRAALALPAFYLFHGAITTKNGECVIEGYPGVVFKHLTQFSALNTMSLVCRKVFDDSKRRDLTGHNFAAVSDETVSAVAEYWAKQSDRSSDDALVALGLLRAVFQDCAKTDTDLFKASAPLCQRIGLLKQHANREAAHLSLDDYSVTLIDCAHVVAALTMIGEIVRSFEDPGSSETYFDDLDQASLTAAKQLFPATPDIRLFKQFKIEVQSRLCWQWDIELGRKMLLEQLPYAISWY